MLGFLFYGTSKTNLYFQRQKAQINIYISFAFLYASYFLFHKTELFASSLISQISEAQIC